MYLVIENDILDFEIREDLAFLSSVISSFSIFHAIYFSFGVILPQFLDPAN